MNKGLICGIYKRGGKDWSNGGISSKYDEVLVIMDEGCGQVFEESEKRPTVKIVKRIIGGKVYVHAEPLEKPKGVGWMAGGCFIHTSDSRFSDYVCQYPISLHDRQESQEDYEMMSR